MILYDDAPEFSSFSGLTPVDLSFMILLSISNQNGAPRLIASAERIQPRNIDFFHP